MLSSPAYMQIIALLAKGEFYTREIARILGRDETDVSRRLRRLEELGIVRGEWRRIADRNVRVYRLQVRNLRITFTPEGPRIEFEGAGEANRVVLRLGAPDYPKPIGRNRELSILGEDDNARLLLVKGPAGAGKTHLLAYHYSNSTEPVVWIRLSPGENLRTISRRIGLFLLEHGYTVDLTVFNAFASRDYVARVLSRESAVIVFDDVHQATSLGRDVASLIRWLAGQAFSHDYRLVLIGRSIPRGVAFWRERSLELYVSEVSPADYAAIASMYSRNPISVEDVEEKVAGRIPLIPLTARQLGFIYDRLGGIDESLRALDKAYYKGYLSEIAGGETEYRMIRVLAVAGRPVPWEALCRAVGVEAGQCRSMLNRLWNHALIEYVDYDVKLHDFYQGLRRTIPREEALEYSRILGRILSGSPSHEDRLRGFRLLAESCDLEAVTDIVEARLEKGLPWPYTDPITYTESLEQTLQRDLTPRERLMITVEHRIFASGLAEPGRVAEMLEELEGHYARASPQRRAMRVRLLSLAAHYYHSSGDDKRALIQSRKALELASQSKRLGSSILASLYSWTIEIYLSNDLVDEALELADKLAGLEFNDVEEYINARAVRAVVLRMTGRIREAGEELESLSSSIEELPGHEYKPLYYRIREELFTTIIQQGDAARALEVASNTLKTLEKAAGSLPQYKERLDRHTAEKAIALAAMSRRDEARRLFPIHRCTSYPLPRAWASKCALYRQYMVD